jgi:hypothetical protein
MDWQLVVIEQIDLTAVAQHRIVMHNHLAALA